MYPSALPPAPMQQTPQAVGGAWGAQGGRGEELRRAWERVGEEERRLQEREAQARGGAAGATGVQARAQGTSGRGGAQALEELQPAWADIRRRLEGVERAERDGERPGERAQRNEVTGSPPAAAVQAARYPAGGGEGGAGAGLDEDQEQGSEAEGQGHGGGRAGAQGERGGGGGGRRGAPRHPGPGEGQPPHG